MKIFLNIESKRVDDIIEEILLKDSYYLPAFQRDFVWDDDDIKSMIDSIIRGFPIGSIILWKPKKKETIEKDDFKVPLIDGDNSHGGTYYYVIDGQQRLTSLLMISNNGAVKRKNKLYQLKTPITIYFSKDAYRLYKSKRRGIDIVRLLKVIKTRNITEYDELKRKHGEELIKKAEEVVKRILNYKLPVYVMETIDDDEKTISEMAQVFIRVNKEGVRIGNVELMLSLLAGRIGGNITKTIREKIFEKIRETKQFDIELQPIIRLVLSNFGISQTNISKPERFISNIEKITKSLEEQAIILEKSSKSMNLAIDFIIRELGIPTSMLLPSQLPIVTLAKYIYTSDIQELDSISNVEKNKIVNWLILTSFIGYYSTSSDTKLEQDLEVIDKNQTIFPYEDLLMNIKNRRYPTKITKELVKRGSSINVLKRSGRQYLFLLYLLLSKEEAEDWGGRVIKNVDYNSLEKHHIFPREFLNNYLEIDEPEKKETLINCLGNITFVNADVNSEIGDLPPHDEDAIRYSKDLLGYEERQGYINKLGLEIKTLQKHFIPLDENLWKLENYEEFIDKRIELIYNGLKKHYSQIVE